MAPGAPRAVDAALRGEIVPLLPRSLRGVRFDPLVLAQELKGVRLFGVEARVGPHDQERLLGVRAEASLPQRKAIVPLACHRVLQAIKAGLVVIPGRS